MQCWQVLWIIGSQPLCCLRRSLRLASRRLVLFLQRRIQRLWIILLCVPRGQAQGVCLREGVFLSLFVHASERPRVLTHGMLNFA